MVYPQADETHSPFMGSVFVVDALITILTTTLQLGGVRKTCF